MLVSLEKLYLYNLLLVKIKEFKYNKTKKRIKNTIEKTEVIYIVDKTTKSGLSDRLWGSVSCFIICKKNNIDYKISWTYPFDLTEFLVPNKYNWEVKSNQIDENKIVYIRNNHNNSIQEKILKRIIRENNITKVYGVGHLNRNEFGFYYNYLFKPSPLLEESVNKCLKEINCKYISITFRFQQLLGDFKEIGKSIKDKDKKQKILEISKKIISDLYENNKYNQILVTSDSTTFLDYIKDLDYVYVIPGNIIHMGFSDDKSLENHLKSFIDFYMIANADTVYFVKTNLTYHSTFAYTAAKVYNKPYKIIEAKY
ncbi:MAG: hypothetical protein J1F12_08975 [Muribaculaceae bacterium]|nr:hypothetical protein [Muribaculaceae bacterium]